MSERTVFAGRCETKPRFYIFRTYIRGMSDARMAKEVRKTSRGIGSERGDCEWSQILTKSPSAYRIGT